jgi:hypothetical protein
MFFLQFGSGWATPKATTDRVFGWRRDRKKEEFPGFMENIRPRNSFPQISVVAIDQFVEKRASIQEHGGIVASGPVNTYGADSVARENRARLGGFY